MFAIDPANIPNDLVNLDTVLFKLERIREYVIVWQNTKPGDSYQPKLQAHEDELLKALQLNSWDTLSSASLLVKEMQEGHFQDEIEAEVVAQRVSVRSDRAEVRQFEPTEFSLVLMNAPLNNAAAAEEWGCRWKFSHPSEPDWFEDGWTITHYFQRADTYDASVTLTRKSNGKSLPPTNNRIEVLPEKRRRIGRVLQSLLNRRWKQAWSEWHQSRVGAGRTLEALRLGLALFIALIGLVAGAKQQLLKLDVVPALLAVFLIGFGADQIKNLLTQRQQ